MTNEKFCICSLCMIKKISILDTAEKKLYLRKVSLC